MLEAIRILGMEKETRFYQASTSELYGLVQEVPQRETTPFYPRIALWCRQALWLLDHGELPGGIRHVCLQRHPVQPRKPAPGRDLRNAQDHAGVARIEVGLQDTLYLGNLDAKRDWGHARDYVEACAGFCSRRSLTISCWRPERRTRCANSLNWPSRMSAVNRMARHRRRRNRRRPNFGQVLVRIDPRYFRPDRSGLLIGDASKAREQLGWQPTSAVRSAGEGDDGKRSGDRKAGGRRWQRIPFELRAGASASPATVAWSDLR